jgi:hypothetical protein
VTFSTNVTVADGTAGQVVSSAVGPSIMRPNAKLTSAALAPADTFSMSIVLDAVARLRSNAVPAINGMYNCHLDPISGRQLFADPDFKQLFQGQDAAKEFRMGRVIELLDCRFIPTTEAPLTVSPTNSAYNVRRPIVCGAGALLEGDFEGMGETDTPTDAIIHEVDGIFHVTRPPLDRLSQIIAQSWYWIGDFCCPTDFTVNSTIVPSASNAYYKRAVAIEHIG